VEDVATVDALSGGRLLLGVGRGGPFPDQFRNFGVSHDDSAALMRESLEVVERLLTETEVDYSSEHFHYEQLSVYPRTKGQGVPIWLASSSPESVALAAERGYGLMGASAAPVSKFRQVLDAYAAEGPANPRPFVAARYLLCAEDNDQARAEALPFIRDFGKNMRGAIRQIPSVRPLKPFGEAEPAFSPEALLSKAIVGDPAACVEQCQQLQAELAPHPFVLLLKPASYDPEVNRRSLRLFAEQVRPQLAS
jgi:alkanesulfonate monooxygenase SsuD/methylene tetrahydromethanopterin reductase-like flavin-dependent oxidoreductase (luciferase family)